MGILTPVLRKVLLIGSAPGDGVTPVDGDIIQAGHVYNGSTWDRVRGTVEDTLLAEAARTSTAIAAVTTNYNAKGISLFLRVTAAGATGGLTVSLRNVEPVANAQVALVVPASAVNATGTYMYQLYPGLGASSNSGFAENFQGVLARKWQARVAHADGASYTYSLSYALHN